jgi:putative tryptophan/tyrosine transport system substrate-binding protein
MRRREFIGALGGAAAWPFAARAQAPTRIPRIGIIDNAPIWDQFRSGLRDHGYVEGRNIVLEYRTAQGKPDLLAAAAAELARLPVDVIATFGTPASLAAKQATTKIPIVAISVGDPVRVGLVASLARPGGNVTGNTILGPDIVAKRLQLLRELIPSASRLAFLWNPDNGSNVAQVDELKTVLPALPMTLISVEVRNAVDFDGAFSAMLRERPDSFQMTNDPFHQIHAGRVIDFVNRSRLPGMYQTRENVLAGGLISYGPSLADLFRRGAGYVHRILQGTKPADLPVEQPVKFEMVINSKTAKAIDLAIPELFLARADEVIE